VTVPMLLVLLVVVLLLDLLVMVERVRFV